MKWYIVNDIDKISNILWYREPTPLTILDYYKELVSKWEKAQQQGINNNVTNTNGNNEFGVLPSSINAIREAEKLLRPIAYYENQFAHIISLEEKTNRCRISFIH